jgi:succinate dehydrogenase / fumarate reductase cytochrome b subunit
MDLGHFEELASGNASAKLIMVIWLAVSAVIGVWIW